MAYNTIYEKLTADPNDMVGALAYIIYKKQKVEFYKGHAGGVPNQSELDAFHAIALLPTSIDSYRSQAEALTQAFLAVALDDLVDRTENETRQSVLFKELGNVSTALQGQLGNIIGNLDAKRTWVGWARDISGNIVVNLLTIVIIGAIVIGSNVMGDLQQLAEAKVGASKPINSSATPATPAAPAIQAKPAPQAPGAAQQPDKDAG